MTERELQLELRVNQLEEALKKIFHLTKFTHICSTEYNIHKFCHDTLALQPSPVQSLLLTAKGIIRVAKAAIRWYDVSFDDTFLDVMLLRQNLENAIEALTATEKAALESVKL